MLEAKVLNYWSPSFFYIKLVHRWRELDELHSNIHEHYEKKKVPRKYQFKLGDICCVKQTEREIWCRAFIVQLERNYAKVFYPDFGYIETVPIARIKNLISDFTSIKYAAIKCHMTGVISVDGEVWPSLTKEYTEKLFSEYRSVFIKIRGSKVNDSLPVEVWVHHTIEGGALEPDIKEWRCLNKKIIEEGLGLPDKFTELSGLDDRIQCEDPLLTNMIGSINDWLKLVTPTKHETNDSKSERGSKLSVIECEKDNEKEELVDTSTILISDRVECQQYENSKEEEDTSSLNSIISSCLSSKPLKRNKIKNMTTPFPSIHNEDLEDQVIFSKYPLDKLIQTNSMRYKENIYRAYKKPPPEINDQDLQPIDNIKRSQFVEAVIVQFQSPSLFYIIFVNKQKELKKLNESIQQYYSKKKCYKKYIWKKGDMCCTMGTQSRTYRRALIVDINNDKVKIFHLDYACTETVPIANLKKLTSDFESIENAAIKCHMSGILSTGGEDWPTITKQYVKELFETYKTVFITVNSNLRNGSIMPVEVWAYHTIQGGDTGPERSGWVCVNKKIIEQGLGKPDHFQEINGSQPAIGGQKDSKGSGKLYTSPVFVSDWLPPKSEACKSSDIPTLFKIDEKKIENKVISKKCELGGTTQSNTMSRKDKKRTNDASERNEERTEIENPVRLEAKVLQYRSPSHFYIALVHQQKIFNERNEKMQKYYSTKVVQTNTKWKKGDRCCTIWTQTGTWCRAVIVEIEKDDANIFYVDFACIETVPVANLKELFSRFATIEDVAIKCHLFGIISAVGEEWPSQTKEYVKELFDAHNSVFITKMDNIKSESMPLEVWVYHTIQGGVSRSCISGWLCLNKHIINKGLGVPEKKTNLSEPEGKNPVVLTDWLPPKPLTCKEFNAIPTYIDKDGVIYLHELSQENTLDSLRKALNRLFEKPDPTAKYTEWSIGEPCIARFSLDNSFYRGRVLKVNEETSSCWIRYIDYGNEESCSFADMRKSLWYCQVPTKAYRCIFSRIQPLKRRWDSLALDSIHKTIVEKECFVKISGEIINEVMPIEIKCNKRWINDSLVLGQWAKYKT